MAIPPYFLLAALFTSLCFNPVISGLNGSPPRGELKIVYAINAGGNTHEDIHGIVYLKDPSNQGVASDFGLRLTIDRVHPYDQKLYQTERYSESSFGYDIPIKEDGNYVLVLKFSEVYFRSSNAKIFNVILNSQHLVVDNLDIFHNAGYATAYDELVPFAVTDNGKKLLLGSSSSSPIRGNRIRLDFVKGAADNPKVNAFYVAKGSIEDIPQLPSAGSYEPNYDPDEGEGEEDSQFYGDEDEEIQFSRSDLGFEGTKTSVYKGSRAVGNKLDIRSGDPAIDPWEDSPLLEVYFPLLISITASVASFWFLRVLV